MFLLLVCFTVLLPVAMRSRAFRGGVWQPWPASADGYRSPIKEAKAMSVHDCGNGFFCLRIQYRGMSLFGMNPLPRGVFVVTKTMSTCVEE